MRHAYPSLRKTHVTATAPPPALLAVVAFGTGHFAVLSSEARRTLALARHIVTPGGVHAPARTQAIRTKIAVRTARDRAVRPAKALLAVAATTALVAALRVRAAAAAVFAVWSKEANITPVVTMPPVEARLALAVPRSLVTLAVLRVAVALVLAVSAVLVERALLEEAGQGDKVSAVRSSRRRVNLHPAEIGALHQYTSPLVLMEFVTTVARAAVATRLILADLLTAAVVPGTLVHVLALLAVLRQPESLPARALHEGPRRAIRRTVVRTATVVHPAVIRDELGVP